MPNSDMGRSTVCASRWLAFLAFAVVVVGLVGVVRCTEAHRSRAIAEASLQKAERRDRPWAAETNRWQITVGYDAEDREDVEELLLPPPVPQGQKPSRMAVRPGEDEAVQTAPHSGDYDAAAIA
jgi:hypothetical protein